MVFDAIRVRLIEIGEAVKDIDAALLAAEPDIPWRDVAGMRDHLAHRYFDTAHSIVQTTVAEDLPPLVAAAVRLLDQLESGAVPTKAGEGRNRCQPAPSAFVFGGRGGTRTPDIRHVKPTL